VSKRCSKCGSAKPVGEFYPDPHHRDGLSSACKPCMRAQAISWQKTHPEKAREIKQRHNVKRRAAAQ
jgi:hypothetical protein